MKRGEDVLSDWYKERLIFSPGVKTLGSILYADCVRWITDQYGSFGWSRRAWANAMQERGYLFARSSGGVRCIQDYELAGELTPMPTEQGDPHTI